MWNAEESWNRFNYIGEHIQLGELSDMVEIELLKLGWIEKRQDGNFVAVVRHQMEVGHFEILGENELGYGWVGEVSIVEKLGREENSSFLLGRQKEIAQSFEHSFFEDGVDALGRHKGQQFGGSGFEVVFDEDYGRVCEYGFLHARLSRLTGMLEVVLQQEWVDWRDLEVGRPLAAEELLVCENIDSANWFESLNSSCEEEKNK